jgi:hypothetical protein
MAIHLGRPLPNASCDRPERRREGSPGTIGSLRDACRSYLVLLPVGFSLPPPLPAARCALTAPFHPCRPPGMPETDRRCTFCGTFPGVAPAGRYPAPHLRGARTFLSPPFGGERPSGRLARSDLGCRSTSVKGSSAFEEAGQANPETISAGFDRIGRRAPHPDPLPASGAREGLDPVIHALIPHRLIDIITTMWYVAQTF